MVVRFAKRREQPFVRERTICERESERFANGRTITPILV
jgi:hypothetical protein